MTLSAELSQWLRSAFLKAFPGREDEIGGILAVASANPEFGDYQCNDAMSLAKALKKAPRDIASSVVEALEPNEAVEGADVAGPGFINIRLASAGLIKRLSDMAADDRLLVPMFGEGKTVVVDYSSPNVAKPMHIGHIRSTIIGNALDRMFRFLGYKVIADNHIGDWGTQFGILIMGYRHFLNKKALQEAPAEELERVYVESYNRSREDEEWLRLCRAELVKLQSGDAENLGLWRRFVELSLSEFDRIYDRLGVSFDLTRGESYYNERLPDVIGMLRKKGLLSESEGAQVVFLEEEKLPVCIVRKSDGGFNYAATDIATVIDRVDSFRPERIVYVTDERQQLHFRQVFAICARLGLEARTDHVWFGLMRLPDATFSTRQGNVIRLERLLDEAEQRALAIVEESSPEMSHAQKKEVAAAVGIGAVKYADLSQNPQTLITFTWEKALALDGNSGPYLQYAYARIASVKDKYAERFSGGNPEDHHIVFSEPIERYLATKLVRFPEVLLKAAHSYKPNFIADYLYDLAQTYSNFYQNVPFLKAPEGIRESRVRLCAITAAVLKKGLDLLGISTPERI